MANDALETVDLGGWATSGPQGNSSPPVWQCRVVDDEDNTTVVPVGARPVVIGADPSCDLILSDPSVSRRHMELCASEKGITIRDLGSTNGTFCQGSEVGEVVVRGETSITVGTTTLRLFHAPRRPVAPSARRRFGGLVGESIAMREVFAVLERVSATPLTVLIAGESGTGKEVAARALHDHSPRAAAPFEVVDCGATPGGLVESALFGHVRGAFTGAHVEHKGAFVRAQGGTVFLDEIGELPLEAQTRLLRALEARTVQPVGGDERVAVDVRIVAATNRDLATMVEQERFRFDLYQRLAVVYVRLPPLRERPEDLPALVRFFYEGRGSPPGEISGANLAVLQGHTWPGNVRELRNALDRAWVMGSSEDDQFDSLQLALEAPTRPVDSGLIDVTLPYRQAKARWLETFERRYVSTLYTIHNNKISPAARQAEINRNYFRKLLEKHGLLKP